MPIPNEQAEPKKEELPQDFAERDVQVFEVCNGYIQALLSGDEAMISVYQDLYDDLYKEGYK